MVARVVTSMVMVVVLAGGNGDVGDDVYGVEMVVGSGDGVVWLFFYGLGSKLDLDGSSSLQKFVFYEYGIRNMILHTENSFLSLLFIVSEKD
ncbi:hypothetical protein Tco_0004299 [Tanacetum coccineum]